MGGRLARELGEPLSRGREDGRERLCCALGVGREPIFMREELERVGHSLRVLLDDRMEDAHRVVPPMPEEERGDVLGILGRVSQRPRRGIGLQPEARPLGQAVVEEWKLVGRRRRLVRARRERSQHQRSEKRDPAELRHEVSLCADHATALARGN